MESPKNALLALCSEVVQKAVAEATETWLLSARAYAGQPWVAFELQLTPQDFSNFVYGFFAPEGQVITQEGEQTSFFPDGDNAVIFAKWNPGLSEADQLLFMKGPQVD